MNEEYDYEPDSCPECGSDRTYWIDIFDWVYKCEECNLIVDSNWYIANEPEITRGKNYPLDESQL